MPIRSINVWFGLVSLLSCSPLCFLPPLPSLFLSLSPSWPTADPGAPAHPTGKAGVGRGSWRRAFLFLPSVPSSPSPFLLAFSSPLLSWLFLVWFGLVWLFAPSCFGPDLYWICHHPAAAVLIWKDLRASHLNCSPSAVPSEVTCRASQLNRSGRISRQIM